MCRSLTLQQCNRCTADIELFHIQHTTLNMLASSASHYTHRAQKRDYRILTHLYLRQKANQNTKTYPGKSKLNDTILSLFSNIDQTNESPKNPKTKQKINKKTYQNDKPTYSVLSHQKWSKHPRQPKPTQDTNDDPNHQQ